MSNSFCSIDIIDSPGISNSEVAAVKSYLSDSFVNHNYIHSEAESAINYLYLLIVEDHKNKNIITLTQDTYCLGRCYEADIIINDPQVSRKHTTIVKEFNPEKNLFLYKIFDGDLAGKFSKNGLIINGQRIKSKYLEHGDSIQISDQTQVRYFVIDKHSKFTDFLSHIKLEKQPLFKEEEHYKKTLTSDLDLNLPQELSTKNEEIIKYVWKLSSFAELSPYPIIEINLQGKLTYLNQAASLTFPDLSTIKLSHPILKDLLAVEEQIHGSLFVRDVSVKQRIYEQYIHYLPDLKVIRSYLFDYTERKQIEAKLKDSEAKYRAIIEQTSEGIFLCDAESKIIIESNTSASKMLGYSTQELIGKTLDYFLANSEKSDDFNHNINKLKQTKTSFRQEIEYQTKDNKYLNVEVSLSIINYHQQEVICLVFRDISQQKQLETRLKYRAYHDSLTSLYNRDLFLDCLGKALANAKINHRFLAVMFLDVDYFKQINDNYGHDIGDVLLQQFALRLKQSLREGDVVARWGGDEFTILLPGIQHKLTAIKVAKRILASLEEPFYCHQSTIKTSSSIGIALFPDHAHNIDSLLKKADEALYTTKRKGRNGYTLVNTKQ